MEGETLFSFLALASTQSGAHSREIERPPTVQNVGARSEFGRFQRRIRKIKVESSAYGAARGASSDVSKERNAGRVFGK